MANELLAFVLEVIAIAALAWWGFASFDGLVRVLAGIGAPLAAVVLWGLFAAPRARFRPGLAVVLVVKALVYGSAAVALYDLGHPALGILFAVVAVLNTALAEITRRRFGGALGHTA